MKKSYYLFFVFMIGLGLSIASCDGEFGEDSEDGENEKKISKNFDDESHRFGENCMNCHISGGEGESTFSIAGSVFQSDLTKKAPNGVMKFYSKPNGEGELLKTIEVDDKANFYTTESMDFSKDVYPVAIGTSGKMQFMSTPLSSGSCTSCHGNTTKKLWIE